MKNRIKIKSASFFSSPTLSHVKNESILGLGPSRFIPASETIEITSYSHNPCELLLKDTFLLLPQSSVFLHEIGHYQLTVGSRVGTIIRDINVIVEGLCLIILKRMKDKHGKIWIPFNSYLNYSQKDKRINGLIEYTFQLNLFENNLIKNWQVTQELFAYAWTGFFSSLSRSMWINIFGEEDKTQISYKLAPLGLEENYKKVHMINEKLREYFLEKEINPEDINEEEISELFKNLKQIFGEEADFVKSYLKLYESLQYMFRDSDDKKKYDFDLDKLFRMYKKETDRDYEEGYYQHIEALKIMNEFGKGKPMDLIGIVAGLIGMSCIYAPLFNPKFINNSLELRELDNIDDIFINVLKKILQGEINFSDYNSLTSFAEDAFRNVNQYNLNEIARMDTSNVMGTIKWNNKIIDQAILSKSEKNFLKRLRISTKVIDQSNRIMPSSKYITSFVPVSMKILLGLFLKMKKLWEKWDWGKKVFNILDRFEINKPKTILNLAKIYQGTILSPPLHSFFGDKDEKEGIMKPSYAMHFTKDVTILYSNKNFKTSEGHLSILKHIMGNVKNLCLEGETLSILCPLSYTEASDVLCTGNFGNCWLKKILENIKDQDNLLICCREGEANFFRIGTECANSPVYTSKFIMEDRHAEKLKKEIAPNKDIIEKIWNPQIDRLNKIALKGRKEGSTQSGIKEDSIFNGNIEDIINYRVKRFQRNFMKIVKPVNFFLKIVFLPVIIDFKFHKKKIIRHLKREYKNVNRTEKEMISYINAIGLK